MKQEAKGKERKEEEQDKESIGKTLYRIVRKGRPYRDRNKEREPIRPSPVVGITVLSHSRWPAGKQRPYSYSVSFVGIEGRRITLLMS